MDRCFQVIILTFYLYQFLLSVNNFFQNFCHDDQPSLKLPQVFELLSQHYDTVSNGWHARGPELHLRETLATLSTESLGGREGGDEILIFTQNWQ